MLEIFKYIGELLTRIVVMWQGISINGFRPFWYLIGIALLTIFGSFLKGLLFSGIGGSAISKLGTMGRKSDKSKQSNNKNGSRVVIVNKK